MALTRTTLTAAISANQLTFGVLSTATGFPAVGTQNAGNQPIVIDNEAMFLVGVPVAGTITVRNRGSDGTTATAHDVLASVITSPTAADFPPLAPGLSTLFPVEYADVRSEERRVGKECRL